MHTNLLAQSLSLPGGGTIQGPPGVESAFGDLSIGSIISRAMPLIFIFAGVGLFLMLISGGFTMLTSVGDSKKLEMGRQRLTNGLIGFLIIFGAFWIVQILGVIFNLEAITSVFG